jgi:hypothetical protein
MAERPINNKDPRLDYSERLLKRLLADATKRRARDAAFDAALGESRR